MSIFDVDSFASIQSDYIEEVEYGYGQYEGLGEDMKGSRLLNQGPCSGSSIYKCGWFVGKKDHDDKSRY